MISNQETLHLSPYMAIYDIVVPKDNILRQINELVDFSFILEELKTKYCLDNGRNAIPPIRMFKYLLLKAIYAVSDVDLVERSKYDMLFKYFLDMAPGDPVIDSSSLTKFRRLRLQDVSLLDMLIGKTVEIALEKKIINSPAIIVDATHTKRYSFNIVMGFKISHRYICLKLPSSSTNLPVSYFILYFVRSGLCGEFVFHRFVNFVDSLLKMLCNIKKHCN